MNIFVVILITFAIVFGLPILAYLVMKFGAAGYFRAKRRFSDKPKSQATRDNKEVD